MVDDVVYMKRAIELAKLAQVTPHLILWLVLLW